MFQEIGSLHGIDKAIMHWNSLIDASLDEPCLCSPKAIHRGRVIHDFLDHHLTIVVTGMVAVTVVDPPPPNPNQARLAIVALYYPSRSACQALFVSSGPTVQSAV